MLSSACGNGGTLVGTPVGTPFSPYIRGLRVNKKDVPTVPTNPLISTRTIFALHAKAVGTVGMWEHGSKSPAKSYSLVFPPMFPPEFSGWERRGWWSDPANGQACGPEVATSGAIYRDTDA